MSTTLIKLMSLIGIMTEVLNLIDFYRAVHERLLEALAKLPNYGGSHSCDKKSPARLPLESEFLEICTNCGGKI
ncbi:MAG: hypothetical protein D6732_12095 [Methanobacteriota archaeon]|nr:MAG: hypothetical protein D6732_12095 [Euryarchaeota archaeon]